MKRIFCLCIIISIFLSGCSETEPLERNIFAMDTMMNVRIWGSQDALDAVCDIINRYDSLFDAEDESSDIYKLNQTGFGAVKNDTAELLKEAIRYCEETDGHFDPTVYPLVRAWKMAQNEPPQEDELQTLLPSVGTEYISIDANTVTLLNDAAVDFGAIAKGYTAQKCIEYLENCNVECAIVTLGGNVQTLGSKPDGSKWAVGIADPSTPAQSIAVLRFEGSMALVTSGSYQRYYEFDGKKYHHILDPETGYPADNELASVTILANNGTMADAFSTALFVMGFHEACEFWRTRNDFEVVFVHKDGSIFVTEGAAFMLSECDFTVIER